MQAVDISTQVIPITELFISGEDAIWLKDLSSVNIPTKAIPLTKLFIVGADAVYTWKGSLQ